MTHEICRDDSYANARVDAAVAQSIAGVNDKPFWLQAQTNLIRWVREGYRLAGEPGPPLLTVAETAADRAKLKALVDRAFERTAGTEEVNETRELERWLNHDWLALHPKLSSTLTATLLAAASARDITVASRDGKQRTPVGVRVGSWDGWEPGSLPESARGAARTALAELRDGRCSTVGESPRATMAAQRAARQPAGPAFGVIENAIDALEQAAKTVKTARRALKNDLVRRNKGRKAPSGNERRLRALAATTAEKMEAAADGLGPEIRKLANPEA